MRRLTFLAVLMLSTLGGWAASALEVFSNTNQMLVAPWPRVSTNYLIDLSGFTNRNDGWGGVFESITNSSATIDYTNVFPVTNAPGARRIRQFHPVGTNAPGILKVQSTLLAAALTGLGTDAPTARLHVLDTGTPVAAVTDVGAIFQRSGSTLSNSYISIVSGTAAYAGLYFGDTADPTRGYIAYEHAVDGMDFNTATTTWMNLSATGDLTLNNLTGSRVVATTAGKALVSVGAPAADGYVLSSTTGGTLSWVPNTAGSTGGNPTASVGLTTVNGAASTFLRSDGAPALSQAIIPTWTGLHQFDGGQIFRSTAVYSTPPTTELKGDFKYNAAATIATLAQLQMGKENVTDGNNAGFVALFTRPNGGSVTEAFRVDSSGTLLATNTVATEVVRIARDGTTKLAMSLKKSGDSFNLFQLGLAGYMYWGPGTGATDTFLYRAGAAHLKTTGDLTVDGLTASKQVYTDSNNKLVSGLIGPMVNWTAAETVTVANTTTATTLLSTGLGSKTVGANILKAGSVVRYTVVGNNNGDTVTPGVFVLSAVGFGSTLSQTLTNEANGARSWEVRGMVTIYGAGGSVAYSHVQTLIYQMVDNSTQTLQTHHYSAIDFDTTATHTFDFTADPSVADADNNISSLGVTLETLNTNLQ